MISGKPVKIAGYCEGMMSSFDPFVFCSLEIAPHLLSLEDDQVTHFLVETRHTESVTEVVSFLNDSFRGDAPRLQLRMEMQITLSIGIPI